MKAEKFLEHARQKFSDNPMDRASAPVKAVLKKPQYVIEAHCHIFDLQCVPAPYFGLRREGIHMENIENFIKTFHTRNIPFTDIDDFIRIAQKGSMEEVLNYLIAEYSIIKNMIYVPLMMDLENGWDQKSEKSLWQQISEIQKLTQKYPVLPFLAIDPSRVKSQDATEHTNNEDKCLYELILDAFDKENPIPMFGIKVYPSLGYFPSDSR